jgi:hypothetical protein
MEMCVSAARPLSAERARLIGERNLFVIWRAQRPSAQCLSPQRARATRLGTPPRVQHRRRCISARDMPIVKQATGYRSLYISVCERQGAMRRGETHRPAAVAAMTAPREARARVRLRRRAASAASGGESAAVRVAGRRGTARERRARTGRLWCACCRTARALRLRRGGRRSGARGACGGSCREHHRARRELRWGQHGHAAAEQQNTRSGGGRGCHARHVTRGGRPLASRQASYGTALGLHRAGPSGST